MIPTKQSHSKPTPEEVIGPRTKPLYTWLTTIGLLLIVAGTLMPIIAGQSTPYDQQGQAFKFIYSAGALLVMIFRILSPYKGTIMRLKRLRRIEVWSGVFFCVAAFFMFYELDSTRNWLAFTLAGAAIQVYTSIMIPRTTLRALDGKVQ